MRKLFVISTILILKVYELQSINRYNVHLIPKKPSGTKKNITFGMSLNDW